MNSREKILSSVIAFLLTVWCAWTLWGTVDSAYEARESQLRSLQRESKDAEQIRTASRRAAAQLTQWQAMSLPADEREARKIYLQWLRHELDEAGFEDIDIKPNDGGRRNSSYQQLRFIVVLNGNLEQLTSFLYKFYRVNCLHKIELLNMRPGKDSDKLALNLLIRALVLPGASHIDTLKESATTRLVHGDLDDYQQVILGRKLFTAYAASSAVPTDTGGPLQSDEAKNTYVTGIVSRPGGYQVWVHLRSTDQRFLLGAGDAVEVGDFHATVISISPRAVVLSSDGQRLRIGLGQNLGEATVLPFEGS